eukprot:TRINITY_DN5415_c0_g1::TRINITY_DN5415_c0_g1_i1::g.26679::m.26679 TRINITY_DN5415_c0_g1::TRINITY_DN5415_c0_g1_i1::g.26679  ORF type:complete len:164 (+),score=12.64,sp/Q9CXU0/MED10_MOUSE/34.71/6e-17,Med10/PF09748.4/3.3e-24,MOSC/PF03473.12/0.12 TRINITY_DN5415_c0_g1_i1:3-494(+)
MGIANIFVIVIVMNHQPDFSKQNLAHLEQQLLQVIEQLRQIGLICENFTFDQPQDQLFDLLGDLVGQYQQLVQTKGAVQDVRVPLDVLDFIDRGSDPSVYTMRQLEECLASNQRMKGKMLATENFRNNLLEEARKAFGDDFNLHQDAPAAAENISENVPAELE